MHAKFCSGARKRFLRLAGRRFESDGSHVLSRSSGWMASGVARRRPKTPAVALCLLAISVSGPWVSSAGANPQTMVFGGAIRGQWSGAAPFGISFNNPMSAFANSLMWQNTNASIAMREPLKNMGYSEDQIDHMSADEMIAALRGGKVAGSAAPIPPAAPVASPPPAVLTFNPVVSTTKTQTAKGELAGLVFPVTTATKFVPAKKRLATKQLVSALSPDPAIQKTLNDVVEAGLKGYDQEAAADGLINDVAGSMAFFVGTCELISNDGKEPDPEGLALVARILQQQFENPKVKKVSAAEKQKMHEFLVGFGSIVLATYFASVETKDLVTISALKDGCNNFAKNMLKVDLTELEITGFGLAKLTA
jgi:hypothetical protein